MHDLQNDPGLHVIAGYLDKTPLYVQSANLDQEMTGRSGFAIPQNRKLPCHTKVACYLSHMYFHLQRDRLTDAQANTAEAALKRYAEMYGIAEDTQKIAEFFATEKSLSRRELTQKVAEHFDSISVEDTILYARELLKGVPNVKSAADAALVKWAFDRPFQDFELSAAKLLQSYDKPTLYNHVQKTRKNLQFDDSANLKVAVTPRRVIEQAPQLLNALYKSLQPLEKEVFRTKIAGFPVFEEPVVMVGGIRCFRERDLLPKLAEINRVSAQPVLGSPLPDPVKGWQEIVESCPPKKILPLLRSLEHQDIRGI